eukprot:TRINITY_DN13760_c0_g2_i1.p1 TRINITY_DN13760_c0_g2~~TRINITY_DN13760_c0_g2_i1.p1  ORF type:complete len:415 (-),score=57.60 TRINITY_DN13760_c0_g2_i1:187-1350(-)
MFTARFVSNTSRAHFSKACRVFAIAGASGAVAVGSRGISAEEIQTKNRRLSDHHRIAITAWSIFKPREQADLDATSKKYRGNFLALLSFLKERGYEGIEITVADFRFAGYFPDYVSDEEIMCTMREASAQTGIKIIGSLLHITDGGPSIGPSYITGLDYRNPDFWTNLEKVLVQEKSVGSEYITFQIGLPQDMNGTGGAYRNDEEFLKLSARRIEKLQEVCFKHGMNFYVEAHIERISEDPEAFCKIFDYCKNEFEVNADLSHYLYRNICRGPHFDRIMGRVGHCHIRMCRKHGDLSADVGVHMDRIGSVGVPAADWDDKGVTWQAVEAMRPALQCGLTSCAIVGEAGPAFTVPDALLLDTKLVPLYRYMASIADGHPPSGNPFTSE